jgi:hypothetical protein
MRRFLVASVVAIGATLSLAVPASAGNKGFVEICNGTASAKNPYVTIVTGSSSVKGHFDGAPAPAHGQNNSPDLFGGSTDTPGQGHGRQFGKCGGE